MGKGKNILRVWKGRLARLWRRRGKGKRISIRFWACLVFCLVFCWVLWFASVTVSRQAVYQECYVHLEDIIEYVARRTDADDLALCASTGTLSEHYQVLKILMDTLKETMDVEGLYLIQPGEGEARVILSAATTFEREFEPGSVYSLGDVFTMGDHSGYREAFSAGGGMTFFERELPAGRCITGARALFDQSGEPVMVLAADKSVAELLDILVGYGRTFLLISLLWSLGFAVLFVYGFSRLRRSHLSRLMHRGEREKEAVPLPAEPSGRKKVPQKQVERETPKGGDGRNGEGETRWQVRKTPKAPYPQLSEKTLEEVRHDVEAMEGEILDLEAFEEGDT